MQVHLVLLNNIAPSTVSAKIAEYQTEMAYRIIHMNIKNVGLMLCRMFTYKKNSLWLLEHECLKRMSQRALSVDRSFGVVFKDAIVQQRPILILQHLCKSYSGAPHIPPGQRSSDYWILGFGILGIGGLVAWLLVG